MCDLLRDYQQRAVDWLSNHERGLVISCAGSGKSRMAAAAVARCMGDEPEHNPTVGWLANTKEQCQQAEDALRLFRVFDRATVHIACAAAGRDWSDCDVLIGDEIHHGPSPIWRKQIETCKGVRWGLTATPWGRDSKRNAQLKAMFGGNVYVIDREEVGQNLAPARVVWLDACDEGLPEKIEAETDRVLKQRMRFARYRRMSPQQARGEVAWGVCCEYGVRGNVGRNKAARSAALADLSAQTIVLVNSVDHAKEFAHEVCGAACWSGMGAKSRREVIAEFKLGGVRRLVATQLLDEGADLPSAEVLVLLSGGRNEARTIQRTGRVLRPHPGKTEAVIYDFKDSTIPLMHRHAVRRAEIYQDLGYAGDYSWI
jgi:superfamily II DNA or RNA helicase